MRALALCALAACSYPEKVLIDANGAPFGCYNKPLPTMADDPIRISGTVADALTKMPIKGGSIVGHLMNLPTAFFTIQSDSSGSFSTARATGAVPLDLYLELTASGFQTTYYYPPHALTHDDVGVSHVLFTTDDTNTFAGLAQVSFNTADSQMLLRVTDCNNTPVAGATVTTSPAGSQIRYFNGVQPSTTATATDNMGIVLVANLPPGNVTVNATVNGMNLRTLNVQSVANTYLAPTISP
jgi:hypothetical protein